MGGPAIIDGKEHPETDNFLPCEFVIDGITYVSAENYFQCAKATTPEDREKIRKSGPGVACWGAGQNLATIQSNWESIKVHEMYKGNLAKFEQNENFKKALIESGSGHVHFSRSSSFWNKWNGLIMERIRAELRQNGEEDVRRANEIREAMDQYAQDNK